MHERFGAVLNPVQSDDATLCADWELLGSVACHEHKMTCPRPHSFEWGMATLQPIDPMPTRRISISRQTRRKPFEACTCNESPSRLRQFSYKPFILPRNPCPVLSPSLFVFDGLRFRPNCASFLGRPYITFPTFQHFLQAALDE